MTFSPIGLNHQNIDALTNYDERRNVVVVNVCGAVFVDAAGFLSPSSTSMTTTTTTTTTSTTTAASQENTKFYRIIATFPVPGNVSDTATEIPRQIKSITHSEVAFSLFF